MQRKNRSSAFKDNFQELLNFVSEAILVINQAGFVIAANKTASTLLNLPNEELVGNHVQNLKIIDEKTKTLIKKQLQRTIKGEKIENYEIPVLIKGETRYFEPDGNRIDYFGQSADLIILRDITEKRQIQGQMQLKIEKMHEQYQEAEGKYRKLFQESTDAIFIGDVETGAILDCNNAASMLVCMDKEELIGQKYSLLRSQMLVNEDCSKALKAQAKVNSLNPVEAQIITKTGEKKHVSFRISFFEFQGKKLMQGTFRDITERKIMQQALMENEEKFHGIANSVRDGMIVVDEKAKVTYWNPAAEKMFGYTSEETVGKDIHDLVVANTLCKEGKERITSSVKMFSETGVGYFTVGSVELMGRRKDDTQFPAELTISPIQLWGKWNAVGVIKDITDRKKAEQKLRETEQRYHTLFNEAPLGVSVIDPETLSFVEFNDTTHLQLDYSREEFSQLTIPDIEAKESSDEVKLHTTKMLHEGQGEFETLHRTKNGIVKNVLVTTRTIELAGKTFLHCLYHDITEIKKVQNALMESETSYRQLVELAHEGIWAFNREYTTVFVNPRMANMLGYTESDMIGKSLFKFIDSSEVKKAKQILSKSNLDTDRQFEYAFPRKDGTYINTSIAASALKDDQGQVIGTLALLSDITERKQLESELRTSEERFRAISTSAMDAIILVNEEDTIMYWNPAAEKTFGFDENEAMGKKLSKLVIPPHGQKPHKLLLNELKHNSFSKRHFELTALKKNRTEFPIDLSVASVKLKNKNCLLTIVKDISEQKKMEASIKQERDMLENITENIGAGLVIVDRDYHILWANNYLKNLNGDVCNKTCYSTFNTGESVCPDCGPKKIFEGAEFDSREYLNKTLHEKGLPCWFELIATPIKDKDGKVIASLELTVDITEKKELEEKIREERNKLEAITENISASLILINKDYQITWMNKFGKQIYGNIVNKTCYSAIHCSDKICPDCGVKKIFNGKNFDIHQMIVNKNDKDMILEVTDTPMKDENGNVIAVLELGMDVTEIKKMQGELSKYSQKLEDLVGQRTELLKETQAKLVKSERLAAIGELAGMIGHDLRNPLSGIKNSAYFLKKKGKTIPEVQAKEMLDTIEKCVDYSNKIVSDLLDYSREIHLESQDCSPRELIVEALALINVPEKVEILNELTDEPHFIADHDKLKRVFINLIKNGIDAMPNVGKLTVSGKEVNGNIEISFSDTGVGIPDEILPKLFAPLFTTKAQGMGFGLAICKRIIEAHKGTITVKTKNGEGTTFTITLPIKNKLEIGGEKIWINVPESSLSTMTKQ